MGLARLPPVLAHGRRHAEVVGAVHVRWAGHSSWHGRGFGRAQGKGLGDILVRVDKEVCHRADNEPGISFTIILTQLHAFLFELKKTQAGKSSVKLISELRRGCKGDVAATATHGRVCDALGNVEQKAALSGDCAEDDLRKHSKSTS